MNTSLKTLRNYLDALGDLTRKLHGNPDTEIRGATADSRQIQSGWIFCAIAGANADGRRFIPDAVEAGAAAVVAAPPLPAPPPVPTIVVEDDYAAAARIAECHRDYPARKLNILGITGTNGKTTCAYLLRDILRKSHIPTGMIGTVTYDLGKQQTPADRTTPTPFRLQELLRTMVDNGLETAVMEVSSHALHQRRLGTMRVKGALFTNLTRDHFDYHQGFEDYFQTKKRLFDEYLAEDPAAINVDDEYGRRLRRELKHAGKNNVLGVGTAEDAEARIMNVDLTPRQSTFTLVLRGNSLHLQSPLIGHFNVANAAVTAALASALGIDEQAITGAIRESRGAPGRLQALASPKGFTVFIDYAHTDDALRNVLQALRELQPRRLTLVFGCGGDRDPGKRPMMGRCAAELADQIILTSDNPRSEDPAHIIRQIADGIPPNTDFVSIEDRRKAIRSAVARAEPGDIVLVAGKGHENYQIIGPEQHHFDDLEEARNAIGETT